MRTGICDGKLGGSSLEDVQQRLKAVLVLEFGKIIKGAVEKQGMLGWQFNTVGVSDAITMGGDGQLLPP